MGKIAVGIITIVAFLIGLGLASLAMSGCSVFESSCTKALPVLTTASIYVDDAQSKVDQAEAIVVRIADPALREKGLQVIAEIRAGIDAATAALDASATACTAPDIGTVFASFIAAWKRIAPFISLLGGPGAGSQVGTPLVMR